MGFFFAFVVVVFSFASVVVAVGFFFSFHGEIRTRIS